MHAVGGITLMAQSSISQRSSKPPRSVMVLLRGGTNSIRITPQILRGASSPRLKNVSASAATSPRPQLRSRASSACRCCCCRRLAWHSRVLHGRGRDLPSAGELGKLSTRSPALARESGRFKANMLLAVFSIFRRLMLQTQHLRLVPRLPSSDEAMLCAWHLIPTQRWASVSECGTSSRMCISSLQRSCPHRSLGKREEIPEVLQKARSLTAHLCDCRQCAEC
mmetsp:Transcript_79357/g.137616  ORF Transcript_79357/g.137616 Transcript_79357/m.137616 type:complete len:223 (+) Transcript_79357:986-1654(+)